MNLLVILDSLIIGKQVLVREASANLKGKVLARWLDHVHIYKDDRPYKEVASGTLAAPRDNGTRLSETLRLMR